MRKKFRTTFEKYFEARVLSVQCNNQQKYMEVFQIYQIQLVAKETRLKRYNTKWPRFAPTSEPKKT